MDSRTAAQLGARLAPTELDGRTSVSYRVVGRHPVGGDGEVVLTGDGTLIKATGRTTVGQDQARAVFAALQESLSSLLTREEAGFPPDSVIGVVTLDLQGDRTELFFMADEQQAATEGVRVPPVAQALDRATGRTGKGSR